MNHPKDKLLRPNAVSETADGSLSLFFSIPEGVLIRYDAETSRIVPIGVSSAGDESCCFEHPGRLSGGIRDWHERMPPRPEEMVRNLTLEMTQQCNMRCAYCLYSGVYDNRRVHGDVRMDAETACEAIRLYASLNRGRPAAHISFYGGEALLEFETIRRTVVFARSVIAPRPLSFSISTNGLLLNEDVVSWLCDNPDVSVLVTLNGPFQDEYRRDRTGEGSLLPILQNLGLLKEHHPAVWANQIRFVCNVVSLEQIRPLRNFYSTIIGKVPLAITGIVPYHGNAWIKTMTDYDRKTRPAAWRDLTEEYLETGDPFLRALFRIRLSNVHERPILSSGVPGDVPTCLPLNGSLFVSANGTLSLCERCVSPSVGTVRDGVDRYALARMYDSAFRAFQAKCASCWAQRLCSACLANVESIGTDAPFIPETFCRNERLNVLDDLRLYCRMALFHSDMIAKLFPNSIKTAESEDFRR